ncbi:molybdenum cofactor biosynthesis protein MoaE [Microbacterium sp. CIAB417]|uniref:molybdenum cofactor biosynthesis protein MoaE n=1 Tax=Microbacterium sp. CIAB417 TaxID=2860287 RepID=UPI001FADCBB5|nr:molybdenum cofactor biosynthesis protein MoaE [Microbacterium sp. CIAB417]
MIVRTAISDVDLDVPAHLDAVAHDAAGATALFVGTVRDHDPGASGEVVRLEYSAHPDAAATLADLAAAMDADDLRIAVTHRIGTLTVGEVAIVCAVSSAHRAEAFEVSRALVERIKAQLPVWKRQVTADGTTNWVGL